MSNPTTYSLTNADNQPAEGLLAPQVSDNLRAGRAGVAQALDLLARLHQPTIVRDQDFINIDLNVTSQTLRNPQTSGLGLALMFQLSATPDVSNPPVGGFTSQFRITSGGATVTHNILDVSGAAIAPDVWQDDHIYLIVYRHEDNTWRLYDPSHLSPGIANGAITHAMLAADAVETDNLADSIIATEAEAEGGVNNVKLITSLRARQAIDARTSVLLDSRILFANNYVIPATATRIEIELAGGGGAGGEADGGQFADGGSTTCVNVMLGINMRAGGGNGQNSIQNFSSAGGDIIQRGGAVQGRGTGHRLPEAGALVRKFVARTNLGGKTLVITYGGGGANPNVQAQHRQYDGHDGFISIRVYGTPPVA